MAKPKKGNYCNTLDMLEIERSAMRAKRDPSLMAELLEACDGMSGIAWMAAQLAHYKRTINSIILRELALSERVAELEAYAQTLELIKVDLNKARQTLNDALAASGPDNYMASVARERREKRRIREAVRNERDASA